MAVAWDLSKIAHQGLDVSGGLILMIYIELFIAIISNLK